MTFKVSFLSSPLDGYETYIPYYLRDPEVSILKVKKEKKHSRYAETLCALISDEDAHYLCLKYPDISENFHRC
jgi:hypothetical protein